MYEFPVKTFFWALSGEFIFREMPDLTEQHDELIDSDVSYFQGTPSAVLSGSKRDGDEEGEEAKEEANEEEEEEQKDKAKNSDETSEEEIKVPTRPLTGKSNNRRAMVFGIVTNAALFACFYRTG